MGIIVLMGGDEFRQNCIPMDQALLQRLPHQPPRVTILPTAAAPENPRLAAENGIRYFEALGATATAALVLDRADAEEPHHVAQIKGADLIYLAGGNPWYLLESLRDSAVWAAIRERWQQGGTIIGSSAGAMVLGEKMRTRETGWVPALGLAARIAVLPHHKPSEDGKIAHLRQVLEPHLVMLGIGETTACVSEGSNTWHVVGLHDVTIYSAQETRRYGPGQRFEVP